MSPLHDHELSTRERQIMDALYALDRATVAEIHERIPEPPTTNAVRTTLGLLHDKGFVKREYAGRAAVYRPAQNRDRAGRKALRRVLEVFHGGSMAAALSMHLADRRVRLSDEELNQIQRLLDRHKGDKS